MIPRPPLILSIALLLPSGAFAQLNVAASANGGVATQSSTYSSVSTADRANNGDRRGDYGGPGGIAHTTSDPQAWWQATFATPTLIDTVNVFNRTDSFGGRINPFNVTLYSGSTVVYSATNQTFAPTITGPSISGMSFATGGVLADRVRIHLTNTNYLQLAEVEAIASPVPEPATLGVLGVGALALLRRRKQS